MKPHSHESCNLDRHIWIDMLAAYWLMVAYVIGSIDQIFPVSNRQRYTI